MQLSRIRFVLWQLMAMVASVACLVASGVAFAAEPITAANVLTGWAALYLLCASDPDLRQGSRTYQSGQDRLGDRPVRSASRRILWLFRLTSPWLVALLIGWIALVAVALFPSCAGKTRWHDVCSPTDYCQ